MYPVVDDGIPIEDIVNAAESIIHMLSDEQKERSLFALDDARRRAWSNPELYVHRFGLRLDEEGPDVPSAVLKLLQTTLSPEGYKKAVDATLINQFLGRLHNCPKVLNRFSYNFLIFGTPSETEPWAFLWYGHHLCISVFLFRTQIVLTPTFTGAEPNVIDDGPNMGVQILEPEQALGLAFMRSLPADARQTAQLHATVNHEVLPKDRWNPADQRHLCGAFQDNRVIPYEGICLGELADSFGEKLIRLVEQFYLYLPQRARRNRLDLVRNHLSQTYFCWIGGFGEDDAFYYRIQSPVVICEFDHHSGVFLTNEQPAKFHIHTIVRSPNGGDYGHVLHRQL